MLYIGTVLVIPHYVRVESIIAADVDRLSALPPLFLFIFLFSQTVVDDSVGWLIEIVA